MSVVRDVIAGAAVGAFFPLGATLMRMAQGMSIGQAQSDPLMWIIDGAPLVLAANAYYLTRRSLQAKAETDERVQDFRVAAGALDAAMRSREQVSRKLDRALFELDRLAHVAAHDLAAPLVGMKNLAEWIRDDISENPPGESMKHVLQLEQRIARMKTLVSRIEDYATASRRDYPNELCASELIVRDAFKRIAGHQRFNLTTDNLMPLETARKPLTKVFAVLLDNAIQHHDLAEGEIKVSMRHVDQFFAFTVFDDGPGIDAMYSDRAFELFVTLVRRDLKEASGAGLAIAKKIVEGEGGEIAIVPRDGRGTEVRFTWPMSRQSDDELDSLMRDSVSFVLDKRKTLSGHE